MKLWQEYKCTGQLAETLRCVGVFRSVYEGMINAEIAVRGDLWFHAGQQRHLSPRLYVIDLERLPGREAEYRAIVAKRGEGRSFTVVGAFDVQFLRSG